MEKSFARLEENLESRAGGDASWCGLCRASAARPRLAAVVVLLMRGEGESADSGIRENGGGSERCEGSPSWGCTGMAVGRWGMSLQGFGTGSKKERER